MPELRKDLVRDNWVVIANDRALKPNDFPINKNGVEINGSSSICPFCEGNEAYTTPEITAFRYNDSKPDTPGWTVRTIPNKYSGFKLQGELQIEPCGIYESCNGLGQHEVIVETPEHGIEFHQFTAERIKLVYEMLKYRYNVLAKDNRIKYIQIYKNRGLFAGASLEHSHSQLLALPMVPGINQGLTEYYRQNNKCLLCNIVEDERQKNQRIICETEYFLLICPYAARFSYETWIIPKRHKEHFGDISTDELRDLAKLTQKYLVVMIECLNDPSYNIVFHSAPVNTAYEKGYHWYMEITPRLIVAAGVEVATGLYMNPVAPELAARMFKKKLFNQKE